mmetsp:Transcript_130664/g.279386  ORF Transcript_130664/g.279386 Transcript_130664/m.279386 type:complete len:202 (-) Transcript_130664:59-664(-)
MVLYKNFWVTHCPVPCPCRGVIDNRRPMCDAIAMENDLGLTSGICTLRLFWSIAPCYGDATLTFGQSELFWRRPRHHPAQVLMDLFEEAHKLTALPSCQQLAPAPVLQIERICGRGGCGGVEFLAQLFSSSSDAHPSLLRSIAFDQPEIKTHVYQLDLFHHRAMSNAAAEARGSLLSFPANNAARLGAAHDHPVLGRHGIL